ncbi:MAG: hypothetical protein H6523_13080 [Mycolicibacterium sp.]|nr:hypothetical protein [Mycolicibacterium sp.]
MSNLDTLPEISYDQHGLTRDKLEELELITREARQAADALDGPASRDMSDQERYAATETIWKNLMTEVYEMDSGR